MAQFVHGQRTEEKAGLGTKPERLSGAKRDVRRSIDSDAKRTPNFFSTFLSSCLETHLLIFMVSLGGDLQHTDGPPVPDLARKRTHLFRSLYASLR